MENISMFYDLFPNSQILKIPIKFVWSCIFNKNNQKQRTYYYILSIPNFFDIKIERIGRRKKALLSIRDFPLGYYVSLEHIQNPDSVCQEWMDRNINALSYKIYFTFLEFIVSEIRDSLNFVKKLTKQTRR